MLCSLQQAFFVQTNDYEPVSTLIGILAGQIKLFQNGRGGDAPESPKLLPLGYTKYDRDQQSFLSTTQISKLDVNPLIDFEEDSEESSSESSLSEEYSTYWIPKSGDIGILQRDFANAIAEQTGCIFCPEPEYKRVRLISGNIQAALAKLQRLEPLLVSVHQVANENANMDDRHSWRDMAQILRVRSITIYCPLPVRKKVQVYATYL